MRRTTERRRAGMKKRHKAKTAAVFLSVFLLTGCGTMNSQFDCPHKPGVMCRSLGQVNAMVDRGMFEEKHNKKMKIPSFSKVNNSLRLANSAEALREEQNGKDRRGKHITQKPLRVGESVVKVWMASYQDLQGNYHNESEIYTAINKNKWIVPKETKGTS